MLRHAVPLVAVIVSLLVPAAAAEIATLDLDAGSVEISYGGTGIEVTGVRHTAESLIFEIASVEEQSSFTVTLERSLIDAKNQDGDISYIVLVNDFPNFVFAESETTDASRTLRIPVTSGLSEIEVVGTSVNTDAAQEASDGAMMQEGEGEAMMQEETPGDGDGAMMQEGEGEAMMQEETPGDGDGAMMQEGEGEAMMQEETPEAVPTVGEMTDMEQAQEMADSPVCGPGTVLGDDGMTCVLEERPRLPLRDLVFGVAAGFGASLVLMLVLYPISRASRRS